MRARSGLETAAAGAGFAVLAAGLYGYSFGHAFNHDFYLPYVVASLKASLYPGDLVVSSLKAGAPTFFWDALACAGRLAGLSAAAAALWWLSRAVAGAATYLAARALGAGRGGAVAAVLLAALSKDLMSISCFAGDPMLKTSLDQTSFAWPFALGAVVLWLRGRTFAAFVVLAGLAWLNPLIAAICAAWLLLWGLLERRPVAALAGGCAATALAAAPVYWRALRGGPGDLALMRLCSPQVYLPSQWPLEKWARAAALAAVAVAAARRLPSRGRLGAAFGALALLFLAAAFAALPLAPAWLTGLQLLRLDVAFAWLALVACAVLIERGLADGRAAQALAALTAAWALSAPGGAALVAWAAALLASSAPAVLAGAGAAGLLGGCAALFGRAYSPHVALVSALLGGGVLLACVARPRFARGARAALAAVLLVAAAALRARRPAADDDPLADVEAWARPLPEDASFLVHPSVAGFRLRALHPVYAEWSDFALALWDRRAGREWASRLEGCGMNWADFARSYPAQEAAWEAAALTDRPAPLPEGPPPWTAADAPRIAALARAARAAYVVAPESMPLDWDLAYARPGVRVYAVPQ